MKRIKIMKVYFIFWLFLYFIVYSNYDAFVIFFFATLTFNLAVLSMLVMGTIFIFNAAIKLVVLGGTFGALAYKQSNYEFYLKGIEKIMPPHIAHMFSSRKSAKQLLFTQDEAKDVVEWLDERFYNQRGYINFFVSTALMIGLLGTFTGLLKAIDDMGKIILTLGGDIDIAVVIQGFSGPLSGMAIGFGSSLFGVAVSVILGVKAYILARNQESFIEGVESWLKGRIVDTTVDGKGGDLAGGKNNFMDMFIEEMSTFSGEIKKMGESTKSLSTLGDSISSMSNTISSEAQIMQNLASLQQEHINTSNASIDMLSQIKSVGADTNKHLEALHQTSRSSLEQDSTEKQVLQEIANYNKEQSQSAKNQEALLQTLHTQNENSAGNSQQQGQKLDTLNTSLLTLGEHLQNIHTNGEHSNEIMTLQNRHLNELKTHQQTQEKQSATLNKSLAQMIKQDEKSTHILDTMSQQNVMIEKGITTVAKTLEQDFSDATRQMHRLFETMNTRLESSETQLVKLLKLAEDEIQLLELNKEHTAKQASDEQVLSTKQHKEIVRHLQKEIGALNALKKMMKQNNKHHHDDPEDEVDDIVEFDDEEKKPGVFSKLFGK